MGSPPICTRLPICKPCAPCSRAFLHELLVKIGYNPSMVGDLTFEELQALTAKAMAAPWYRLRFPDRLEQLLNRDTDSARLRYFILAITVGLLLFVSFLISDHQLIPDVFPTALMLRAVVGPPIVLISILLIRHTKPGWLREAVAVFPGIVAAVIILVLFLLTRSPFRADYLDGMFLIVVYNNTITQARFPAAVGLTLVVSLLVVAGLVLAPEEPVPIKSAQLGIVLSVGIMTLMANFELERERRRQYLLNLREKLANDVLESHNRNLRVLSEQDGLTGAFNRRSLDINLPEMVRTSKAQGQAIGVIMIDVDHFKAYNDGFGHLAGDDCLRRVAAALIGTTRNKGDMVARYGGEEFVVVLTNAPEMAVNALAERLRKAVIAQEIPTPGPAGGVVTASLGLAQCGHQTPEGPMQCTCTPASLLGRADEALYAAKQSGRNRVCVG